MGKRLGTATEALTLKRLADTEAELIEVKRERDQLIAERDASPSVMRFSVYLVAVVALFTFLLSAGQ